MSCRGKIVREMQERECAGGWEVSENFTNQLEHGLSLNDQLQLEKKGGVLWYVQMKKCRSVQCRFMSLKRQAEVSLEMKYIERRNETQGWQDKRKPFYGGMHCYDKIVWMMLNIDMLNMK